MAKDVGSGFDGGLSTAELTPATTPSRSPRPAGSIATSAQAGAGKQQSTQALAEFAKIAGFTIPSTQEPAASIPNQASVLSLLCLIAGSVLASAANATTSGRSAPPTDDAVAEPDPPEVLPEDQSSCDAAEVKQEAANASLAQLAAPVESCRHCSCASTKAAEPTAQASARPEGTARPSDATTPDAAAAQKPTEPVAAPGSGVAADKTAPENKFPAEKPQSEDKPPTDNQTAAPDATPSSIATETKVDVASTPEPQTPMKEEPPSLDTPSDASVADEVLAAAESGDAAPDGAEAASPAADGTADVIPTTESAEDEAAKSGETTTDAAALKLPDWFLGNNVVLYDELAKRPSILQLFRAKSNTSPSKPDANAATKVEETSKTADVDAGEKDKKAVADVISTDAPVATSDASTAEVQMCRCKASAVASPAAAVAADVAPATKPAETNSSPSPKPVYQLHQDIYDEALDLLSSALQPPVKDTSSENTKKAPSESWITQSSFLVQSPKDGSLEFLEEVVRQVGRDVQADIITIELDDLEDLCQQLWHDSDEVRAVGPKYLTSPLRLVREFFGYAKPEEKSKAAVACILQGAASKREGSAKQTASPNKSADTTTASALAAVGDKVVAAAAAKSDVAADILQAGVKDAFEAAIKILQAAIREAFAAAPKAADGAAAESKQDAAAKDDASGSGDKQSAPADKEASDKSRPLILLFRNVEAVGKQTPLQRLVEGVNKLRREEAFPVILVGTAVSNSTSEVKPTTGISKAWDGMDIDDSTVVNVSPRNTRRAGEALKQHAARTKPRAKWRLFRRSIRVTLDQHPSVKCDALYPSGPPGGESVVDELEDEHRRQTLADWDDTLSARVVRQVSARAVRAGAVTPADVFDVMGRVMRNQAILNKMNEAGDDEFVGEDGDSDEDRVDFVDPVKKSKVKTLLDSIFDSCTDAEREYFDCVVDTVSVSSAAQDIHMDQSLMDSLKQLLAMRTIKPYGLLAKEAVNGAILYGPPGTGKTHLARVVAASAGTNLIVATPADIQNMWVGETEKRIKALFSLGTKLAPCVVFLDEGDSIFGRRESRDHDWQRKAMSQFLMEMDGLVSRKKAPFLMVATNRPGDIDEAVCRRLPHTLHIGMPTAAGRRAILDIYLKDEKLDEKLDLDEVAADSMTKGFSGSDIRTLCVQAAMAAHKALEAENKEKADGSESGVVVELSSGTQKRVIKLEHFKTALERTRPSVSRESLMEIERFTGQQDESGDHRAMYI